MVQAPALQRVVHVARAVRRDHHDRRFLGAERAELGDGDREVGEDLEQERLELVVGAVDLVDEQDRRRGHAERLRLVRDRPQQGTLHEEALGVELVLDDLLPLRFDRAEVQQLARVVPLVDGLGGVDALVALQAHELAARPARQHLGDLGLADARLALEQQRALQAYREEDRGGEALVGQVLVLFERGTNVVDGLHVLRIVPGDPTLDRRRRRCPALVTPVGCRVRARACSRR